jgi:RNA polymerase sigma-70 factor (ECF subfamily)
MDGTAFQDLVEPHRRELEVHCYRLLGSMHDAEDALQDTLLAAWRHHADFEGRSSVRTWLYRIATNHCLDRLRADRRVPELAPLRFEPPEPTATCEAPWLEPYVDPAELAEQREAISLAYVRSLQLLPARQRIVLVLRDVLDFPAAEVATMLATTEEAVTSALKRARATLRVDQPSQPPPAPFSAEERRVLDAWIEAWERFDIPRLVELLTEDAWLRMPPMPYEYHGREAVERFFSVMTHRAPAYRARLTRANGQPAYGAYREDPDTGLWRCTGLFVMALAGDRVYEVTRFEPALAQAAGLPLSLD